MNKTTQIVFLVIVMPIMASARISGVLSCSDLLKEADIVVKGEVLSVKTIGPVKGTSGKSSVLFRQAERFGLTEVEGAFRVDRVINGNLSDKNIAVKFFQEPESNSSAKMVVLNPHEYLILFLKKSENGYTLMDFDHGKMQASKVTGHKTHLDGKAGLGDEVSNLLDDSDVSLVGEGLNCLGALGETKNYLTRFESLKNSKDPTIRWKSLVWLARSGDDSSVNELLGLFSSSQPVTAERLVDFQDAIGGLSIEKRRDLSSRIVSFIKDDRPGVRLMAVRFFRSLKEKQYIPTIIPLLEDNDKFIRYSALMTICESVRPSGKGCPSTTLYDGNPSKYITEWKSWWEAQNSTQK